RKVTLSTGVLLSSISCGVRINTTSSHPAGRYTQPMAPGSSGSTSSNRLLVLFTNIESVRSINACSFMVLNIATCSACVGSSVEAMPPSSVRHTYQSLSPTIKCKPILGDCGIIHSKALDNEARSAAWSTISTGSPKREYWRKRLAGVNRASVVSTPVSSRLSTTCKPYHWLSSWLVKPRYNSPSASTETRLASATALVSDATDN